MNSIPSLTNADALAELISAEKHRIRGAGDSALGAPFCIRIPLEQFDLLNWLKALPDHQRIFWSNRDHTIQFAGIGNLFGGHDSRIVPIANQLNHIQHMLQSSNNNDLLRVFVAGAFCQGSGADEVWSEFDSQSVVLPELSVIHDGDKVTALITVLLKENTTPESHLPKMLELSGLLQVSQRIEDIEIRILNRRDQPDKNEWERAVITATTAISHRLIDKVVLARRTDFRLEKSIDPVDFLARLAKSNPHCYQVLYAPSRNAAFLSLSPERLFRCNGHLLSTEAVAGTIARGRSEIDDLALENKLRNSAKDRAEQAFVVDGIAKSLEPLCEKIEVSAAASVMKLSRVQHLISEFRSILKPGTSLGSIYSALHPTAAVCGTPRAEALRLLTELERFDRGWYAGGIGVVSADQAEFAVGIRSAVLRGDNLSLFTGAGIVSQSNPSAEWLEIEEKMNSIIEVVDKADA